MVLDEYITVPSDIHPVGVVCSFERTADEALSSPIVSAGLFQPTASRVVQVDERRIRDRGSRLGISPTHTKPKADKKP